MAVMMVGGRSSSGRRSRVAHPLVLALGFAACSHGNEARTSSSPDTDAPRYGGTFVVADTDPR